MPEDLIQLIDQLTARSTESQTVEFKASNDDAFMIGKDISALSNAAAIEGQDYAYMLWGVDDATHDIVGTTFNPLAAKHKGQELELWLRLKLSKNAEFKFIPMDYLAHLARHRIPCSVRRHGIHPFRYVHAAYCQEFAAGTPPVGSH